MKHNMVIIFIDITFSHLDFVQCRADIQQMLKQAHFAGSVTQKMWKTLWRNAACE